MHGGVCQNLLYLKSSKFMLLFKESLDDEYYVKIIIIIILCIEHILKRFIEKERDL